MKKQKIIVMYCICLHDDRTCNNSVLTMDLVVEKEQTFMHFMEYYNHLVLKEKIANKAYIGYTYKKEDEYQLVWDGKLMYGRDKETLIKAWEDAHRVIADTSPERFEADDKFMHELVDNLNSSNMPVQALDEYIQNM